MHVLIISPLVLVHIWHAYMLARYQGPAKPDTISEHATLNERWLMVHCVVHIGASVTLAVFAVLFLLPKGYHSLAILLTTGAVFDVFEVLTLNKNSTGNPVNFKDPHALSTWGMALSYMFFTVFFSYQAGQPALLTHGVWVAFIVLITIAGLLRFKKFWFFQMIYFVALSVVILAAYAQFE